MPSGSGSIKEVPACLGDGAPEEGSLLLMPFLPHLL